MTFSRWVTASVCLTLLCTGCAASLQEVREKHRTAQTCCPTFREFSYRKLDKDANVSFNLDEKSPAFAFDSGKSYFAAFELPPAESPLAVTVSSYVIGDNPEKWYILYPAVLLLDRDFNLVRTVRPDDFGLGTG